MWPLQKYISIHIIYQHHWHSSIGGHTCPCHNTALTTFDTWHCTLWIMSCSFPFPIKPFCSSVIPVFCTLLRYWAYCWRSTSMLRSWVEKMSEISRWLRRWWRLVDECRKPARLDNDKPNTQQWHQASLYWCFISGHLNVSPLYNWLIFVDNLMSPMCNKRVHLWTMQEFVVTPWISHFLSLDWFSGFAMAHMMRCGREAFGNIYSAARICFCPFLPTVSVTSRFRRLRSSH